MPRDNNPKRENLLNLALDATERELEQSVNLQAGYNKTEKTWEVIIRYSTSLDQLRQEYPQITIVELLNGYAIAEDCGAAERIGRRDGAAAVHRSVYQPDGN